MVPIKMNKVLIAIDYCIDAQKIAEIGFAVANSMNADMMLLHVMATPQSYSSVTNDPIMGFSGFLDIDNYLEIGSEELEQSAYEYLNYTKRHLGADNIETIVKEGNSADTILEVANFDSVDIIIIGNHNKKWLEKIMVGSTSK